MPEQFFQEWKPKYSMLDTAANAVKSVDEWAHEDPIGGSSTPPLGVLSDFVGLKGLGNVLEGAAYGQNKLTTGRGQTLKPTDDALDALSAGLGGVGAALRGSRVAAKVGGEIIKDAAAGPLHMSGSRGAQRGIFGGRNSKVADIPALERAIDSTGGIEVSRADNEAIRQQTGWVFDKADRSWKHEIPDDKSISLLHGAYVEKTRVARDVLAKVEDAQRLRQRSSDGLDGSIARFKRDFGRDPHPEAPSISSNEPSVLQESADRARGQVGQDHEFVMGNVFAHDKLYEAYPAAKNYKIIVTSKLPKEVGGDYLDGVIRINSRIADNPKLVRSIILHELDHSVQDIEGFGSGGSTAGVIYQDKEVPRKILRESDALAVAARLKSIYSATPKLPKDEALSQALQDLNIVMSPNRLTAFSSRANHLSSGSKTPTELYRDAIDLRKLAGKHEPLTEEEALSSYHHLPGEAMARNTQARSELTVEQRRGKDPLEHNSRGGTLDVFPGNVTDYKPKFRLSSAP